MIEEPQPKEPQPDEPQAATPEPAALEAGPEAAPIPERFYRECEGTPFEECQNCSGPLTDGREYLLVKGQHAGRCVLELALCGPCIVALSEEFSEESWQVLREAADAHEQRPEPRDAICSHCGKPPEQLLAYSRMAVCKYGDLIEESMVCDPCDHASQDRLSAQTRGEIDDFMQGVLPGVPELEVDLPRAVFSF